MQLITPDWPAPENVKAISSSRQGGVSLPPYDSLNFGDHVGDNSVDVKKNRQRLCEQIGIHQQPYWLNQIHSDRVVELPAKSDLDADASFTTQSQTPCVVMTADCLPVLFTNSTGTEVAAAHAGWRGLADGILEQTVKRFSSAPGELMVWFGPAISVGYFEVGDEVKKLFVNEMPESESAFQAGDKGKWFADLYELARIRLRRMGVVHIYGGEFCTYADKSLFYSYRREGVTGRMATMIWLDK